jgi:hypothetical protein
MNGDFGGISKEAVVDYFKVLFFRYFVRQSENLKGTDHLGDKGRDGRVILKWILKKQDMRVRIGVIWVRIGTSNGLF